MFARINEVQEEYQAKGWMPVLLNLNKGIFRGCIELWCWGLFQLYSFLALILEQIFVGSATGVWLELLCRIVNIERKKQTKAVGTVLFSRIEAAGNVPIPAGRIVKTLPDGSGVVYRFITTAAAVLLDGDLSVAVPVVAEEYGSKANVSAGMITEIVTSIPGVDAVGNLVDWLTSEGADTENDDSLRARYILAWQGNNGCTKYAYESWALSVTGVVAAKIMDQHPRGQGTVDIVIQGTAGVPTAELLAAVDKVIKENVPVNDDELVKGVVSVPLTLAGTLALVHGDPDLIVAQVTQRLNDLFANLQTNEEIDPFRIGDDVILDRIVAVIMAVDGIKQVLWTSPADNIAVSDEGLAILDTANFTTSWAEAA